MLLPAEVLPFLFHEDRSLRRFASGYLGQAHDPSPVTADDVWAAIDRVTPDERTGLSMYLPSYPLTPRSTERVFEGLRSEGDIDLWNHFVSVLEDHPPEDIRRAVGDPVIARQLDRGGRATRLQELLRVLDQTFDQLWKAVEDFTAGLANKQWCIGPDWARMMRLRRGLLRFPRQATARALEVMRRPAPQDGQAAWTQALAVLLFEKLREPEALEPLLDLAGDTHPYLIPPSDWALDALVHLGTVEVIAAATARYESDAFRRQAPRILARIKRPEAERALIDLFLAERRIEDSSRLGMALCELCSTAPEVLETLRDMAEHELFDPLQGHLDEVLLVTCGMHGWEPDDAPLWRRRITARHAAEESMDGPGVSLATAKRSGRG